MKEKLKGCRALDVVQQDFSQTCAALGAAYLRTQTLPDDMKKLVSRAIELNLEIKASEKQTTTTNLQVVEEGQTLEGPPNDCSYI